MIPADLASRLLSLNPEQQLGTQPTQPVQKIADALSDLEPGAHVKAQILGQLPNGAYRALIAQREITLALPFSANTGDSLELEVVESNGKLAFAVANNNKGGNPAETTGQASVSTTLSQTGKMIGDLLGDIDQPGKRAAPAALNGNQPLLNNFSGDAADIVPVLKDALSKSGVFYEAHQARWVAGELPTEQLLKEPQGRLSTAPPSVAPPREENAPGNSVDNVRTNTASSEQPLPANLRAGGTQIPGDLVPLVQQQLDALATQTYAWQGQIWPDQQMSWEIDERSGNNKDDSEQGGHWQTRLKLKLPQLGGIDASLRLNPGNQVEIFLATDSDQSETRLLADMTALQERFEAAGLNLVQFKVKNGANAE